MTVFHFLTFKLPVSLNVKWFPLNHTELGHSFMSVLPVSLSCPSGMPKLWMQILCCIPTGPDTIFPVCFISAVQTEWILSFYPCTLWICHLSPTVFHWTYPASFFLLLYCQLCNFQFNFCKFYFLLRCCVFQVSSYDHWNIVMVHGFKSLSDISNVWFVSILLILLS